MGPALFNCMNNIVERARIFATAAHAAVGQLRKYTNEPYIVHPTEVVEIVTTVDHTPEMLAAAYLHDVVEDTSVTVDLIRAEFGPVVASYVHWLTNPSKAEDGNRSLRKEIDRQFIKDAPAAVQTVKLADLISNTSSIVQYDPKFAKVYLEEKRLLLEVLSKGDAKLLEQARKHIG